MQPPTPKKITRNREFKACTECRKRKLKCDRASPCGSCVRREDTAHCVYDSNINRGPHRRRERMLQAEDRLQHLEELVKDLSQTVRSSQTRSSGVPSEPSPPSSSDAERSNGTYHGSTQWAAMLDDISDLRAALEEPEPSDEDHATTPDEISILFGASTAMSFDEILQTYLPARQELDDLVSTYFSSKALTAPFLHTRQFDRQYQEFHEDVYSAPPLWTALLFSILDISSRKLKPGGDAPFNNSFAVAAARCLAYGRYHQPQKHAVESLLLFAQARCITSMDFSPSFAPLFGALIRLATSMGYHQDPSSFPNRFSVFEAEMRRRTWSLCMQLDVLVSFQLGLPPTVSGWNTRVPANLLDSDFDEDSLILPPSRPDSEPSEQLFYIAKHRLFVVFEKIVRHALSTDATNLQELEILSGELLLTYNSLPLLEGADSDITLESPHVTVTRLCVRFVYFNSICVLHRKYVTLGRQESIQACCGAASDIVHQLADIYPQFQPGQRLGTERWFVGSMTWHHFLLACTALCLVACTVIQQDESARPVDTGEVLNTLQKALSLCKQQANRSRDTRRAIKAIHATIYKVQSTLQVNGSLEQPEVDQSNDVDMIFPEMQYADASWDPSMFFTAEDPTWASLEQFLGKDYSAFGSGDSNIDKIEESFPVAI